MIVAGGWVTGQFIGGGPIETSARHPNQLHVAHRPLALAVGVDSTSDWPLPLVSAGGG